MRANYVSGLFRFDGGLERPSAGTIACPAGRPTEGLRHVFIA
jgi:hypothetical protein